MYGFEPNELIDLQARRIAMYDENVRTWWVFAIPTAAIDRRTRKPKEKTRSRPKKGKG